MKMQMTRGGKTRQEAERRRVGGLCSRDFFPSPTSVTHSSTNFDHVFLPDHISFIPKMFAPGGFLCLASFSSQPHHPSN